MTHVPTFGDAAADIKRCFYASLSADFYNKEYLHFLDCALRNIDSVCKSNSDIASSNEIRHLRKVVDKTQNKMLSENNRRENLLLASQVLLDLHIKVSQI